MKLPIRLIYCILLLLGIVLRLIPYFINHSLWLDESLLTLNLIEKKFAGLLLPLKYAQVVPVLFLIIEKTFTSLFGYSEYVLRLFPLLNGLLILPLAYHFTKIISGNVYAALISLFLFATYPLLIFYSTEVRQYGSDVFATLCLFTLVFEPSLYGKENRRCILLLVVGSILIFLSHVIIFELFIIGIYYLGKYRLKILKEWRLWIVFAGWIIALAINYFEFIYKNPYQNYMVDFWMDDFMPLKIFSTDFWTWMHMNFLPDALFYRYWEGLLFFFGLAAIVFIIKKRWLFLYLLLFPVLLHLILSGLKIYPFEQRHNLYLCAFIIPAISIGIVEFIQLMKKRIFQYSVAIALVSVLVYGSLKKLIVYGYPSTIMVHYPGEIRDCIDYVNANISDGQKVYVVYYFKNPVIYYIERGRVKFTDNLLFEEDDWKHSDPERAYNDISRMHGVNWLLFANTPWDSKEEDYTLELLKVAHKITILKTYKAVGCTAFLADINPIN